VALDNGQSWKEYWQWLAATRFHPRTVSGWNGNGWNAYGRESIRTARYGVRTKTGSSAITTCGPSRLSRDGKIIEWVRAKHRRHPASAEAEEMAAAGVTEQLSAAARCAPSAAHRRPRSMSGRGR